MIRATATTAAPPDRLWSLVGDLARWGELLPTVTAVRPLQPGPPVVGSRFELRQPGLPKAVWEVAEWRPGTSFTWISTARGLTTTATHVVTAEAAGSRLDLSLDWSGPLAGPVRLLYGRRARGMVETEAETFARLAGQP